MGLFGSDFSFNNDDLNRARGLRDDYMDPTYGQEAFMQTVRDAAPTLDTFLAQQAANGGSEYMAREQSQAARGRAMSRGLDAYNQYQQQAQQTAANMSMSIAQESARRQQYEHKANRGGGLKSMLGTVGGTLLGSFAGPMGAQAGAKLGGQLFGGGGSGGSGGGSSFNFGSQSQVGNYNDLMNDLPY